MKYRKIKGTSLIVVFIICTVIGILLSTTFIVAANYSATILPRKKDLYEKVKAVPNVDDSYVGE